METYNLTEMVMNQFRRVCIAGTNRETVIEYFLDNNFKSLLGNYILAKDNSEVFLKKEEKNQNAIEVKSIYYPESIVIRVVSDNNKSANISAKTESELALFDITITSDSIFNNIAFEEADKSVKEHQEVKFANEDASEFRIYRLEDGSIAYDGK